MNWKISCISLSGITIIWVVVAFALESNEQFAWEISSIAGYTDLNENVLVSPLLLQAALTLLYFGSEGHTAQNLRKTLHLEQYASKTEAAESMANFLDSVTEQVQNETHFGSVFYTQDHPLLFYTPKFKLMATLFHMPVYMQDIDYGTVQQMISYFAKNVKTDVGRFFQKFQKEESLFLHLSAFKFQAPWADEFKVEQKKLNFSVSTKEKQLVDRLSNAKIYNYGEFPELRARAIEIPFQNEAVKMLILLPDDINGGLERLEHKIRKFHNFSALVRDLKPQKVSLNIPKFHVNYYGELSEVLDLLKMGDILTENADFGGAFASFLNIHKEYLSAVLHKTELIVDETGLTPRKSSFSITSMVGNYLKPPIEFTVDRPFYYAIRTEEAVLLAGHIVNVEAATKKTANTTLAPK